MIALDIIIVFGIPMALVGILSAIMLFGESIIDKWEKKTGKDLMKIIRTWED